MAVLAGDEALDFSILPTPYFGDGPCSLHSKGSGRICISHGVVRLLLVGLFLRFYPSLRAFVERILDWLLSAVEMVSLARNYRLRNLLAPRTGPRVNIRNYLLGASAAHNNARPPG